MLTERKVITQGEMQFVSFEVADAKGRVLGSAFMAGETEFVAQADDVMYGYRMEPGFYFSGWVMTTKDGNTWGAGQSPKHFKTAAERDDYIASRIANQRKAAQKKAGK